MKNLRNPLILASLVFATVSLQPAWGQETALVSFHDETFPGIAKVYVDGHWTALDAQSKLDSLQSSRIDCVPSGCNEVIANLRPVGPNGAFDLYPNTRHYDIERWTPKEIIAATDIPSDDCPVRIVLKLDRVQKRVFFTQSLLEPINPTLPTAKKLECSYAKPMSLELKFGTAFEGVK